MYVLNIRKLTAPIVNVLTPKLTDVLHCVAIGPHCLPPSQLFVCEDHGLFFHARTFFGVYYVHFPFIQNGTLCLYECVASVTIFHQKSAFISQPNWAS